MSDPIEAAVREAARTLADTHAGLGGTERTVFGDLAYDMLQHSLVSTVRAIEREATLEEAEGVCEYSRDKRNIRALKSKEPAR